MDFLLFFLICYEVYRMPMDMQIPIIGEHFFYVEVKHIIRRKF